MPPHICATGLEAALETGTPFPICLSPKGRIPIRLTGWNETM
jgi:hypothetical protein